MKAKKSGTVTCDCIKVKDVVHDAVEATKEAAEHAKKKLTGHDYSFHVKKNLRKDAARRECEQHEYMKRFERRQPKRESHDTDSIDNGDEKPFYYKNPKDAKQWLKKKQQETLRKQRVNMNGTAGQQPIKKGESQESLIGSSSNKLMKSQTEGDDNFAFEDAREY